MLSFAAFSVKDLQNFKAFLNECEGTGVTDIVFIRERLEQQINRSLMEHKILTSKVRRSFRAEEMALPACPSCGKGRLQETQTDEDLHILTCRKCRYSVVK